MSKKKSDEDDEVEQLLRAAQDEMLLNLNLTLNSHTSRSSTPIDPDLDRRFQTLKNPAAVLQSPPPPKLNNLAAAAEGDDLFARFAALKYSIPSHHSSQRQTNDDHQTCSSINQHEDDDDEVEKLIKWAIDAARLDPSPPSDHDQNNDGTSTDDDEDYVDRYTNVEKKGKCK